MHFAWTRDSRYVLFEQDREGDENFHLFRADPLHPDAKAVDLTPMAGARAELIDLPRGRPGEAIVAINGRDKRYFDAYRLDLETGELRLIEQNPGDVDAWHVDSHGDIRACTARVGTTTEIRARDSTSGPFRTLATYTDEESPSVHGFSADGTYLYFSSARDANTERLVKLDLKTDKETLIDADPDYDLSEVLISDRTNQLLGVAYNKDRLIYNPFDEQFVGISKSGKLHEGEILFRSSTDDEQKWIIAYNSPTDPGATYLYDRATGQAQFLYRPRPWLPLDCLAEMRPISFSSRDGLTIHGYLTLPKGVAAKNPYRAVVHGGLWERDRWGSIPRYNSRQSRLCGAANQLPRVDGIREEFERWQPRVGWQDAQRSDRRGGLDREPGHRRQEEARHLWGELRRLRHLAALAFRPKVFACGVDYVGVSNLLTFMNTIPPYWKPFAS